MENDKKTVYLAAILGLILLIILFVWLAFGRSKVVSPVPDEGIKVIFTSPSPTSSLTPTPSASSSPTPKATAKPTVKPTATPKPSASASPSASPKISPSPTP